MLIALKGDSDYVNTRYSILSKLFNYLVNKYSVEKLDSIVLDKTELLSICKVYALSDLFASYYSKDSSITISSNIAPKSKKESINIICSSPELVHSYNYFCTNTLKEIYLNDEVSEIVKMHGYDNLTICDSDLFQYENNSVIY